MNITQLSLRQQVSTRSLRMLLLGIAYLAVTAGFAHANSDEAWNAIMRYIDSSKGDRALSLLVYEPVAVADEGEPNGRSELKGFTAETAGFETAIRNGVQQAKGNRDWKVFYYKSRDPIKAFYQTMKDNQMETMAAKVALLKAQIANDNKDNPGQNLETLIWAYINAKGITVFVYDDKRSGGGIFWDTEEFSSSNPLFRQSTVQNAFRAALEKAFGPPT